MGYRTHNCYLPIEKIISIRYYHHLYLNSVTRKMVMFINKPIYIISILIYLVSIQKHKCSINDYILNKIYKKIQFKKREEICNGLKKFDDST